MQLFLVGLQLPGEARSRLARDVAQFKEVPCRSL